MFARIPLHHNPMTFEDLLERLQVLRSEDGCAWTREQTFASLKKYLIEECYECAHALEACSLDTPTAQETLLDELGDLFYQLAFHITIANEKGWFGEQDVFRNIYEKITRRHPHVFGSAKAKSPAEVATLWEEVKQKEGRKIHQGIPKTMPALLRAHLVSQKCAALGFDWPDQKGVVEKIEEEWQELLETLSEKQNPKTKDELGDLFFSCTQLSRHLGLSSEEALHACIDRFQKRFQSMENQMKEKNQSPRDLSMRDWQDLWEAAKKRET